MQAVERLYRLTVDASQANRQLTRLNKSTGRIASGFGALQRASAAAFSAMGAIRGLTGLTKASDQLELLEGSFEALTTSAVRAADMTERVFRTVADTGASLEDTASTFQRLTIGFQELGGTNEQIDAVANAFIKLGRVSGTSMFDTNAALIQFSQGLASGKLQGDELRSIMERLPLITRLIADEYSLVNDGIEITRGMVKQLGREGKISAEIMGNALLRASDDINEKFSKLVFTLEQELNSLASTFKQVIADFSQDTGIGDNIKEGIRGANRALIEFSKNIGQFNVDMNKAYEVSGLFRTAILAVATAFVFKLIPATIAAGRALLAFSLSNPFTAFALAIVVGVTAVITNWDRMRPWLLYKIPSWFYNLLGNVDDVFAGISIGAQKVGDNIFNFFAAAINKTIALFNSLSESLDDITGGSISFGAIDPIVLKKAEEAVSDFTKSAQDNFTKATEYAVLYDEALAGLAETAANVSDKFGLFGDGDNSTLGDPKDLDKLAAGMQKLQDKVLNTIDPLRELELVMDELHTLLGLGLLSDEQVNTYISLMDGTAEATEKAAAAVEKAAEQWEKYAQGVKDTVDPMQAIIRQFDKVDQAVEKGIISEELAEQYKNRLLDMEEASRNSANQIVSVLDKIKNSMDGFARDFTNELVDGLKKGEFAFKDFAASILETMAKIVLNSIFEKFFSVIFSGITGSYSGGSSGGGVVPFGAAPTTSESTVGVLRSPTYGNMASNSSSAVSITVNNNAAVEVETISTRNSGGGIDIGIFIESKVNEALNSGGMDKAMRTNFGLSRRAF